MKHYNIYQGAPAGQSSFQDSRGTITDIFYACNINHGCIITNEPGAIRGNHFHRHTTQYALVLEGSLTYWSKPLDGSEPTRSFEAGPGDMLISPPNEIHAMQAGSQGCRFLAFAEGPRGGQDYEADTYRVDSIIA